MARKEKPHFRWSYFMRALPTIKSYAELKRDAASVLLDPYIPPERKVPTVACAGLLLCDKIDRAVNSLLVKAILPLMSMDEHPRLQTVVAGVIGRVYERRSKLIDNAL